MKKLAVAAVLAITGALGATAFAADLPSRKAPPVAPVVVPILLTWQGCYVGANGGGIWVDKHWTDNGGGTRQGSTRNNMNLSGGDIGLQAGCRMQTDHWVLGMQIEHDLSSASSRKPDLLLVNSVESARVDFVGDADLTAGYAFDRVLLTAMAGLAWEGDRYRDTVINGLDFYGRSETRTGLDVALQIEYAFTDNLSIFARADYMDFGTRPSTFSSTTLGCGNLAPVACTDQVKIRERKELVRVGLNWKFGVAAVPAVVAKY